MQLYWGSTLAVAVMDGLYFSATFNRNPPRNETSGSRSAVQEPFWRGVASLLVRSRKTTWRRGGCFLL